MEKDTTITLDNQSGYITYEYNYNKVDFKAKSITRNKESFHNEEVKSSQEHNNPKYSTP